MAYDDPHWIGGIGMIGTKASYNAAVDCELFLMLGTDYPYSEFLPHKGAVAQIDDRAEVLGRRAPTALGVFGSVRPSIKLLLDRVSTKSDTRFQDQVNAERRKWDAMLDKQADPNRSKDRIHPQAVARTVSDLAKKDAVFVFDTGLNTLWSANWLRQTGSQRIIGSFNNAAVGTALAQANGIQALDRSRQVIALCGDGGFNMLMSEFLTAVHHKLPVKAVVYNNSAFGLITLEAESIGLLAYREGIEFPNPDYVALANAKDFAPRDPATCVPQSAKRLRATGRRSSIALWRQTKYRTFPTSNSIRSATMQWQRSKKPCSHSVVAETGGRSFKGNEEKRRLFGGSTSPSRG
jgi:thiamine pyrophosphate-dependent acetolactate synthase large subunit-like protein